MSGAAVRVLGSTVIIALILTATGGPAFAQSASEPNVLDFCLVFALFLALFFVPSIVAFARDHPNRWLILVINAVFGATGLGWLGCLVWACHAAHLAQSGSVGGESGLNLFVNDFRVVRTLSPIAFPLEDLSRLKTLLDSGAIDHEEFRDLKGRLLIGR